MNILVLGGLGFIGINLIKSLVQEHNVTVFDNKILQGYSNIKCYTGDFRKIKDYSSLFENIDVVYHLISTTIPNSDKNKINFDIETNLIPTVEMLNICVDKKVKKVIFTSSGGTIYGNSPKLNYEDDLVKPFCAYSINKYAIERYLDLFYRFYGVDYTVLRISNPYGKNHINKTQGIVNVLIDNIRQSKTIEIYGDGTIERDYIYIDDVVDALVMSLNNTQSKIFNISTGKGYSINQVVDILKKISKVYGYNFPEIKYCPARVFDIQKNCLDNSLAKKELGWRPKYNLEDGIKKILEEI